MALKVGLVGTRGIGGQHAEAHKADPLSDFVAVCDLVKERADSFAERFGVKAYYSLKDMLDGEPDLDVIDVCTGGLENGSWHYEPAMQAMDAGKHVLVEKPLSNDIFEAREMVAKAREKNVYLGCNLNHYFTPPAERAKKYVTDGEIGEQVFCLMKMGFQGGEQANYKAPTGANVAGFPTFT
ncbi:MAG: Gfo/Idh/MocA family oxidoreductase [Candidatus Poribacteria bacterium]|nr:Gfo/Idh/MocA family oxidoreductase [Candidatus Poribacteria bacterium]